MIRRFNRYELKYVLPTEKCGPLIDDLRLHLRPDVHGGETGYQIVSLYYDSPDYDCFWAKIEGLKFRRKVRLRIYVEKDLEDVTMGMVEIKQRINRTVQKRRLVLPLEEAEQLCEGHWEFPDLDASDMQVAQEVTYLSRSMHLRPAAITAYWRRAWEGELSNAGLRVTFDTDLRTRITDLSVNSPAENIRFAPADWCIMEVKANDSVPDWITSLLGRHDCQLRRVSKYCAGLSHLTNMQVMPFAIGPETPNVTRNLEQATEIVPEQHESSAVKVSGQETKGNDL